MIQKGPSNPKLRAVSCNWIIHYMWQLFPLEADWEINNQGIKSRTVKLLFLFPMWPITSAQFKHLQCHSDLWHFSCTLFFYSHSSLLLSSLSLSHAQWCSHCARDVKDLDKGKFLYVILMHTASLLTNIKMFTRSNVISGHNYSIVSMMSYASRYKL